jgi:ubiquinone/menaquinone biosynthesis C-methylase UbiE
VTTASEEVRRVAIDHHDAEVSRFESYYRAMDVDRFANAFTYGRHKVDVVLDDELRKLGKGATVLDVGCGTGAYLKRFAAMGLVPSGIEPAPGMLDVARRENPTLRVELGVATELPFGDESFDAVVAIEVLRYLHRDDVRRSLVEMLRVLKPGGRLLVTLVNRHALDGFFVLQRIRQAYRGVGFDKKNPHCEFFTPREAEQELARAGAVDVRTEGRLFAPVRLAYKAAPRLASRVAARIESIDDAAHASLRWTKPFAGHLIAMGTKPARSGAA